MNRASTTDLRRGQYLRRKSESKFVALNQRIWRRLPASVHDLRPARAYGAWLHSLVSRYADREMHLGTSFYAIALSSS